MKRRRLSFPATLPLLPVCAPSLLWRCVPHDSIVGRYFEIGGMGEHNGASKTVFFNTILPVPTLTFRVRVV